MALSPNTHLGRYEIRSLIQARSGYVPLTARTEDNAVVAFKGTKRQTALARWSLCVVEDTAVAKVGIYAERGLC